MLQGRVVTLDRHAIVSMCEKGDEVTDPFIATKQAFGIAFSMLDLGECARLLASRDPAAPFAYVATPNAVHVVHAGHHDARFRVGLDDAWVRLCDSRVVRALARVLAGRHLPLATGSDLTATLFESVITPDDPICVIGADQAVCDALRARYGLRNLSMHVPPFGFIGCEADIADCIAFVRDHPSRFVLIVCGAPQSEMLASRLRATGQATGIGLCVGASLLFLTGRVPRAPRLMRDWGLEWLHRIAIEPRRMLPRLFRGQLPLLGLALRYLIDPDLRRTHAPMPDRRAARVSAPPTQQRKRGDGAR